MSGDIVPCTSATYAVVDFAKMKKKKNKNVCVPEEVQESDFAIPLYAVIENTITPIAAPEKSLEYTHDTTDLANNEISMYEELAPSSTSCLSLKYSQQDKDKSKSEDSTRAWRLVCWALLVMALLLVAAVIACLVITIVVVSPLKAEIKSLQQHTPQKKLIYNLLNSGLLITFPAASCALVLLFAPSLPSGDYWIKSSNGSAVRVYCDMTRTCGNITGGWMRVAELDMTDTAMQCPRRLMLETVGNSRTCIPGFGEATCTPVYYPTHTPYSFVCGMIKADPIWSPDGFHKHGNNVSTNYVDGVSVTHGKNPRHHIWTMAFVENSGDCSCETNRPSFVASDFFCFGNHCMMPNTPPWFYKQLSDTPTNDDIEMRVCRDQHRYDEDISIEAIEFYIQ